MPTCRHHSVTHDQGSHFQTGGVNTTSDLGVTMPSHVHWGVTMPIPGREGSSLTESHCCLESHYSGKLHVTM